MASYQGQTRTAYTEMLRRQAEELAAKPIYVDSQINEPIPAEEPKKRGRKPKEV
jgi:hypothetical protein